jgi:hypothetical protein
MGCARRNGADVRLVDESSTSGVNRATNCPFHRSTASEKNCHPSEYRFWNEIRNLHFLHDFHKKRIRRYSRDCCSAWLYEWA